MCEAFFLIGDFLQAYANESPCLHLPFPLGLKPDIKDFVT